jgi:hypothetical protein
MKVVYTYLFAIYKYDKEDVSSYLDSYVVL